ncbi:MAG TPA: hypothetical protein VIP11_01135 [Gemmatimonadaceae bacterium]
MIEAESLDVLASRAQRHQDEIDRDVVFFTIADLAKRWRCVKSTVREIPFDQLPWKNLGRGLIRESRRYHRADVEAYENAGEGTPGHRPRKSA